jgi:hypothetical protein
LGVFAEMEKFPFAIEGAEMAIKDPVLNCADTVVYDAECIIDTVQI